MFSDLAILHLGLRHHRCLSKVGCVRRKLFLPQHLDSVSKLSRTTRLPSQNELDSRIPLLCVQRPDRISSEASRVDVPRGQNNDFYEYSPLRPEIAPFRQYGQEKCKTVDLSHIFDLWRQSPTCRATRAVFLRPVPIYGTLNVFDTVLGSYSKKLHLF
jgi:hypothetical protein